MEVVSIAYSRTCLLESKDQEYLCTARGMADRIYQGLAASIPEMERVDVILARVLWKATGQDMDVIHFCLGGDLKTQLQVADCIRVGADTAVKVLAALYKQHKCYS